MKNSLKTIFSAFHGRKTASGAVFSDSDSARKLKKWGAENIDVQLQPDVHLGNEKLNLYSAAQKIIAECGAHIPADLDLCIRIIPRAIVKDEKQVALEVGFREEGAKYPRLGFIDYALNGSGSTVYKMRGHQFFRTTDDLVREVIDHLAKVLCNRKYGIDTDRNSGQISDGAEHSIHVAPSRRAPDLLANPKKKFSFERFLSDDFQSVARPAKFAELIKYYIAHDQISLSEQLIYDAERRKGDKNLTLLLEKIATACLPYTADHHELVLNVGSYADRQRIDIMARVQQQKLVDVEKDYYGAFSKYTIVLGEKGIYVRDSDRYLGQCSIDVAAEVLASGLKQGLAGYKKAVISEPYNTVTICQDPPRGPFSFPDYTKK